MDLLLDSGAFTAWQQGIEIDLASYIDFCHEHKERLWHYVSLDVIPGKPKGKPTFSEIEDAARTSWRNLMLMRRAGLEPMPVFHIGERFYWLEKMLGEGFPYIGLGGVARGNPKANAAWFDEVFGVLCGKNPYPSVKVHGFGVTSISAMLKYPWSSVDSVSWMLTGSYGCIMMPHKTSGQYDYTRQHSTVQISLRAEGKENAKTVKGGDHFNSAGKRTQQQIIQYIEEEGFTLDEVQQDWAVRATLNCRFFTRFAAARKPRPFRRHSLLPPQVKPLEGSKHPPKDFKLILSMVDAAGYQEVLRKEAVRDRLFSFFYFDKFKYNLPHYLETGVLVKPTKGDTK